MSLATPAFLAPQQQLQLQRLVDIPYLHSTPDSPRDVPWLPDALEPARDLRPGKRSNHHSSKKSKKKRRKRRRRLGAYALQLIGLLCLVLAALKGFEPLTGVGFTFVMIGYKQGLGKGEKTRGKTKPDGTERKSRSHDVKRARTDGQVLLEAVDEALDGG